MASTPSHPFWLLPLDLVASGNKPYGDWPEAVTGPDALFYLVNRYLKEYSSDDDGAEGRLDGFLKKSEMKDPYVRSSSETGLRARAGILINQLVLPEKEVIFPFWWGEKELESVCKAGIEGFDPETCQDVLNLQALGSRSITYWSHSWNEEGGHDKGHLSAMESWMGVSGGKYRGARQRDRRSNENSCDDSDCKLDARKFTCRDLILHEHYSTGAAAMMGC